MVNLYLTEAAAETTTTGNSTMSLIMTLVMYGIFIFALWFILFRPQKKEQKRLAAQIAAMEIGDCVLTTSGFIGIVIDINDDTVIVEFGNNKNCRIPMEKSAICRVEKQGEAQA